MFRFQTIEKYRGVLVTIEFYTLCEHAQQAEKEWCHQHGIYTPEDRKQRQEEGTSFTIQNISMKGGEQKRQNKNHYGVQNAETKTSTNFSCGVIW